MTDTPDQWETDSTPCPGCREEDQAATGDTSLRWTCPKCGAEWDGESE